MNEHLAEYYNAHEKRIRESSWSQAFLLLVVTAGSGLLLFVVIAEMYRSEQARQLGLIFLGITAAYLLLRYAIVWVSLRRLKIQLATKAMIE